MLQLHNHSPFCPSINLFSDENGIDTLYVVIRATFAFPDGQTLQLAEEQLPAQQADEYWGEPGESSLKYLSEMHLRKPATDIVLIGHAYVPDGKAAAKVDCGIKVGDCAKRITVFGDRYWQGKNIGPPEPFERMPLIYENAFGGSYVETTKDGQGGYLETVNMHPSNPVGRGFRKPGSKPFEGEKLPNLEHPEQLIRTPKDRPEPAGLGFVSAGWEPRLGFAGTYDDAWQENRAPYLPDDFDNRFFNAASTGMTSVGYLTGGEPVILVNVARQARIQFSLPQCNLRCGVKIGSAREIIDVNLETVLIEPDDDRLVMTWRGQLQCDKRALDISEVHVYGDCEGIQRASAG